MERLTHFQNGHWRMKINGCQYSGEFIDRLAAYEDSGLSPEKCAVYGKADREGRYIVLRDAEQEGTARLRELALADKDGRVIVTDAPSADERDGLQQKYRVYKTKDNTPVEDCFVLRPEKDPAARIALEAYAKATENKVLAEDILAAIGDSGRVVILPCEPGTPVYMTFCGEVWEMRVGQFHVNGYTEPRIWADIDCDWASTRCVRWDLAVGKTVFLTREEAEKALEAMNNG